MATFRTKYRIPDNVKLQHYELREWLVIKRPPKSVFIPMIAIIEGGMEIPMGKVTRDFLINFRLSPTQWSPNLFRVLVSVDMINWKMGTNLTWHDVNWVYNNQKGKDTGYYLSVEFFLLGWFRVFPSRIRAWMKISSSSRVNDTMGYTTLSKMGN